MSEGLLKERILKHFINWTMGKTALEYRRNEVTKILSEAAKEFHDWLAKKPSFESGYILQARVEQRPMMLAGALDAWMEEGAELIKNWFGEQ